MVLVYSRPSCAPCKTLKYWLERKGIAYKEFSPDGTDIRIVPTVVIGENVITGLNFQRLSELLA